MRGSSVAVAVSVLAHVLLFAGVATRDLEPPPSGTHPVAAADPVPSVEIEVSFVDADPATPAAASIESDTRVARRTRFAATTSSPRAETASTTVAPSTGDAPDNHATPRSPYLSMRGAGDEKRPLTISDSVISDFLAHDKPLAPPPDLPGERVGNEIADLRHRLARSDRYSPEEVEAMRGELVERNEERANEELKPNGGGTYRTEKPAFTADVAPDGTVKITEHYGLMDRFMKKHGTDPYSSSKREYLDRTRDQRVAIAKRHRDDELAHSTIYMQQNIARLWAMTTDVQKRKQGLFELWDECLETGTPEEVAGGTAARAFVMNHIRANVTYTADELRVLAAHRHSTQPFAP